MIIVIIGAGGTACFRAAHDESDQVWETIQATGTLRVGLDASYPPFEYLDHENRIVGFDVDLATEIGRRLGLEVVFVNISYDGLYDALLIGQVDILLSALVSAPEFEGRADFSGPYFNIGEHLITHTGSSIQSMEDLADKTVVVEYGSGGDVEVRLWERRVSGLAIIRVPEAATAIQTLAAQEADAALVDGITAYEQILLFPDLRIVMPVNDVFLAAAFHPDSDVLHQQVDIALRNILTDGTIEELMARWFGLAINPLSEAGH